MSAIESNGSLPPSKTDQVADLLSGKKKPDAAPPRNVSGEGPNQDPQRRPAVPQDPPPDRDRPALELDDDDTGDPEASSKKRGRSAKEYLAEAGIKERDFYSLEVDTGLAGEAPMSIGALKDHFRESRNFERERDDFEDRYAVATNEIVTSRQQIQDVFNRIASVVPPETMARVFSDMVTDQNDRLEKARVQLREYFPSWSDAAVMRADRTKLETHLATYGFSKHEIGSIQDPRLVKYAMDAMRLKERYERRLAELREPASSSEPPARRQHRPNVNERAKALAARGDKAGAVALLVQGTMNHGNGKLR